MRQSHATTHHRDPSPHTNGVGEGSSGTTETTHQPGGHEKCMVTNLGQPVEAGDILGHLDTGEGRLQNLAEGGAEHGSLRPGRHPRDLTTPTTYMAQNAHPCHIQFHTPHYSSVRTCRAPGSDSQKRITSCPACQGGGKNGDMGTGTPPGRAQHLHGAGIRNG